MAVAGIAYLAAVSTILAAPPPRRAIWLILGIALALRLPLLFAPPFLSSDVFRYVWDGKVQAAGFNPYRYVPADPALAPLRDTEIYPHVNRATYARTIYPPAAELLFALASRLAPTVFAMKAMMLAFELAGMLAVLRLLALAGLPPARLLIYAWNPLTAWAFGGNGHVDAPAVGLIGLALLAAAARRPATAGVLLGGAILVKFLPAALAPALWRRWDWRLPTACAGVIVALYLVYIGVGRDVFGFLPDYAAEEGIDHGDAFWFLSGIGMLLPTGGWTATIYEAIAAALLALAAWIALAQRPDAASRAEIVRICGNAAILAAATMVVLSPHYAWLALPCCVYPLRSVIYLSVGSLLLYLNPSNERFVWASLVFVPTIILAVLDVRRPLALRLIGRASQGSTPLFRGHCRGPHRARGEPARLPLPRGDEPLQPAVRNLPAHLRDARAAGRHELVAVHADRRSGPEPRARRTARGRRTDAGARPAAHDPLSQGARRLRAVQHQRHAASCTQIPVAGRERPRRAACVARRRGRPDLREDARQGFFRRIVRDVGRFAAYQREHGIEHPRVSLWLTGLRETVRQLPDFVRLAAELGVREVYLQRMVFDDHGFGMARASSSLFERTRAEEQAAIDEAVALGGSLGVRLDASGATEPGLSLKRQHEKNPWSTCRRPWSLMYFTANAAPCPAASPPFRPAITTATPWATRRNRASPISGTAPPTRNSAPPCSAIRPRKHARAVACAGAFECRPPIASSR